MKQNLTIMALADGCSLCLDSDGRKASKPAFVVGAGELVWHVCGPHLAALVKASSGEKPKPEVKAEPAKPAVPVTANALVK